MHKFMKAIGFSNCYTKRQMDDVIKLVMAAPDEEEQVQDGLGRKLFQMKKEFARNMGVSIIGEIDKRGFRNVLFSFPYLIGNHTTTEDDIQLQKFAEKDAYAGISEDYNLGVSLIFYLINIAPIIERQNRQQNLEYQKVRLSALSTEGKVLFGVQKDPQLINKDIDGQSNRSTLIQEAKNGDMDAIENLTLEDIDLYTMISRRALTEDVYSIVDTTFMPYGVESDQYSIIGHIDTVERCYNRTTEEIIYVLQIDCNGMDIKVAINQEDLVGEPLAGRRFKGNIWLQGLLELNNLTMY